MVEREYGYIAATFAEEDIKPFQDLTKEIVREEDLYRSDTVNYIQGDVSAKLHLTLFYGLIDEKIDKNEMVAYLAGINMPQFLSLGDLIIKKEHNGFCQILWVDVINKDGKLKKISEGFKRFFYEESVQLGFVPHLTLAYVNLDYALPSSLPEYPHDVKVEEIKYLEK